MSIKQARARYVLEAAEAAADRYDGLGAPMNAYRPHVAELRRRVLGPDFNGVVQTVPERFSTEAADGEGR